MGGRDLPSMRTCATCAVAAAMALALAGCGCGGGGGNSQQTPKIATGSTARDDRLQNAGGAIALVVLDHSFVVPPIVNDGGQRQATDAWIDQLKGNGAHVFGYVAVNSGQRLAEDVDGEIASWLVNYPSVDGIYLDEGPNDSSAATQAAYAGYAHCVRWPDLCRLGVGVASPDPHVTCRKVFAEASQFPDSWVLDIGDYVLTWEGDINKYFTNYDPGGGIGHDPSWWTATPDSAIGPADRFHSGCPSTPGSRRLEQTIWGYTPKSLLMPGQSQPPSQVPEVADVFKLVDSRHVGNLELVPGNGPGPMPANTKYFNDELSAAGK
jgi:hypothetical protein